MSRLIEHLRSFNRKERFILLEKALGSHTFRLSDKFRDELKECLGLDFPIPSGAYVAMDYHLDWLHVAVHLRKRELPPPNCKLELFDSSKRKIIKGTQEDVDLLVAFERADLHHILLVEAKGDTPWREDQLTSKSKRLRVIFDDAPDISPHFVMVSPQAPRIDLLTGVGWSIVEGAGAQPAGKHTWHWMPLALDGLRRPERCCRGATKEYEKFSVKEVKVGKKG